jgi:hypothetical protein
VVKWNFLCMLGGKHIGYLDATCWSLMCHTSSLHVLFPLFSAFSIYESDYTIDRDNVARLISAGQLGEEEDDAKRWERQGEERKI